MTKASQTAKVKPDRKTVPVEVPESPETNGEESASAKENGNGKKKKKPKPPPKIVIRDDYCKGCGICIAFCPTQVLGFKGGKAVVDNLEACIRCQFCELRCPDFAISVED